MPLQFLDAILFCCLTAQLVFNKLHRVAAADEQVAYDTQQEALMAFCRQSVPLGMMSQTIRDHQITASSIYPVEWDQGCAERNARVYLPNGLAWCARYKSASEWLQVDLGVLSKVTSVITQGRSDGKEWVTSYMVSYSAYDQNNWLYVSDQYGNRKIFEGNTDSYSVKHAYLDEPILARFVKFHTLQWNRHPSMRVEIVGCQMCNSHLSLPPFGKVTAFTEKSYEGGSSCQATDGYLLTNKAWCARHQNTNQWIQFDLGPPTLVTGVSTKGRGDASRNQWVIRYRLSYSNDSKVWYFYQDSSDVDAKEVFINDDSTHFSSNSDVTGIRQAEAIQQANAHHWGVSGATSFNDSTSQLLQSTYLVPDQRSSQGLEFGANSDSDTERIHYLNSPFFARYVRFHPTKWFNQIAMRAGIIGCPHSGVCNAGFMRVNDYTPCVENLAFNKESWVSNRRQLKRHVRNQWKHGHAAKAVDGQADDLQTLDSCTVLDNFDVDKPVWMVNIGRKAKISGIVILTWLGGEQDNDTKTSYRDYMYNLDKLVVYADNKGGKNQFDLPANVCGSISRVNDALFRPKLHIPCDRPITARYVYIEAWGVANRHSRLFSAVLCEVMIYE